MNSKKVLFSLICCSMFGIFACSSDDSSSSSSAVGDSSNPATADANYPASLYAVWQPAFIHTLADEKALYPELGAEFNEIFGTYLALGYAPVRVLWQTSTDSKCLIDEANGTNMYERGCTVSEGIGYGMLLSLFQNDWATFNGLWIYSKAYRESPYSGGSGLMPWLVNTFSWTILDQSSATDADLDIATALIIAYYKTGDANYLNDALTLMTAIWNNEINTANGMIYSGDTPMWHTADPAYNLSYFSPVALAFLPLLTPVTIGQAC